MEPCVSRSVHKFELLSINTRIVLEKKRSGQYMYGESIFTTVIIIGLDKRLDLSGYG